MTERALAGTLAFGALALAAGALSARPAGFILIAAAFCVFQLASVAADARLQARITGPSRVTVTSLAGLGTELATILVFGIYAAASPFAPHRTIFAFFSVPYVAVAAVLAYREVSGPDDNQTSPRSPDRQYPYPPPPLLLLLLLGLLWAAAAAAPETATTCHTPPERLTPLPLSCPGAESLT
jgi:hypothetical protein